MVAQVDRKPIAATIALSSIEQQVLPIIERLRAETAVKLRELINKINESQYVTASTKMKMPAVPTATAVMQAFCDWLEDNISRSFFDGLNAVVRELRQIWLRDELRNTKVNFLAA